MTTIREKASKKLEEIRSRNANELKRRKNKLYNLEPRLKEIEDENKTLALRLVKVVLGSGENLEDLRKESEDLKKEKIEILKSFGFEKDYLDEIYTCKICKDTGVDGTKECVCKKKLVTEELYRMSGIINKLEKENFSKFDLGLFRKSRQENEPLSPKENMSRILRFLKDYCKNFDKLEKNSILFTGQVGVGKTFLLNCIAKEILDKEKTVVYQTSSKLLNFVADYNFGRLVDQDAHEKIKFLRNSDLLIIDDLGTEYQNGVTDSHFFELINDRIVENKATIISTNLDLEEIRDRYDNRIFSRLLGNYNIINVFGDDLRIKKYLI